MYLNPKVVVDAAPLVLNSPSSITALYPGNLSFKAPFNASKNFSLSVSNQFVLIDAFEL